MFIHTMQCANFVDKEIYNTLLSEKSKWQNNMDNINVFLKLFIWVLC